MTLNCTWVSAVTCMYRVTNSTNFCPAANYPAYVDVINKAIKQFDDYTCLKWVPRDSAFNTASYKTYIEFFSERYLFC